MLKFYRQRRSISTFRLMALIAAAKKIDLMVLDHKPGGCQFFHRSHTAFQVENFSALSTNKMMMMALGGGFVAWRLAGNFYQQNLALVLHPLQSPVDGGDSESGNHFSCCTLNFLSSQGMSGRLQDLSDGFFLAGVPAHFGNCYQ